METRNYFSWIIIVGFVLCYKKERKSSWRGEEDETAKKQKGKANMFRGDFH